jgi:signal transduction histidine kinase
MTFSAEKKLALKISIISFFVLIFILGSIIFSSYVYGKNRALIEFTNERRAFEWMRFIESMTPLPLSTIFESWRNMENEWVHVWPRKWPRDVIVFDKDKRILKNDVVELDETDIWKLFSLDNQQTIMIDEKVFFVAKEYLGEYTLFLLRDISPLHEYYEQLIIIALIGSLLGFIIIFLMANHLAKITITPIREHNRELEAYSHNVAHELRTPLAVMRQNLELLKLKPSEKLINSTDEEISGMEHIINSLLFLAKPDNNHTPKEKTNLTKELQIIEETYGQDDMNITYPKKPLIKELHKELFRRIMNNLIENARKYRKDGSAIDISLSEKNIRIENLIDREFTEGELQNLTKAFYQCDTSRGSTGYGLGLALVAKIVEIEGWGLDLRTQNKKFIVTIIF